MKCGSLLPCEQLFVPWHAQDKLKAERLLKRNDAIADLLGVEVITPEAFVEKVREAKARNEDFERQNKEPEGGA